MGQLRVELEVLGDDLESDDGMVHVTIRDTTMADTLHPLIAEASAPLAQMRTGVFDMEVPDGAMEPRHRYSLFAHVDHSGDGSITGGDLISTEDIEVRPDHLDEDSPPVRARVRRI